MCVKAKPGLLQHHIFFFWQLLVAYNKKKYWTFRCIRIVTLFGKLPAVDCFETLSTSHSSVLLRKTEKKKYLSLNLRSVKIRVIYDSNKKANKPAFFYWPWKALERKKSNLWENVVLLLVAREPTQKTNEMSSFSVSQLKVKMQSSVTYGLGLVMEAFGGHRSGLWSVPITLWVEDLVRLVVTQIIIRLSSRRITLYQNCVRIQSVLTELWEDNKNLLPRGYTKKSELVQSPPSAGNHFFKFWECR